MDEVRGRELPATASLMFARVNVFCAKPKLTSAPFEGQSRAATHVHCERRAKFRELGPFSAALLLRGRKELFIAEVKCSAVRGWVPLSYKGLLNTADVGFSSSRIFSVFQDRMLTRYRLSSRSFKLFDYCT